MRNSPSQHTGGASAALKAGTAIIGKVGIDQTAGQNAVTVTPGSTETKITAAAMPAGGVGFVGWLSGIWYLLTQALPAGLNEVGKVNWRHFNVAATAITRPANVTAYSINDSISDNATAGSVTALPVTVSDTNDDPVDLTEINLDTTDTGPGTAGAIIRCHIFNSDPTASSGVVGGDNAAWSNKRAGWVGSFSGTMRLFSDGSKGVLIPDEGSVRIANVVTGAKTLFYQLQTLTAFTPSANSTVFTPRFKGFQGRT